MRVRGTQRTRIADLPSLDEQMSKSGRFLLLGKTHGPLAKRANAPFYYLAGAKVCLSSRDLACRGFFWIARLCPPRIESRAAIVFSLVPREHASSFKVLRYQQWYIFLTWLNTHSLGSRTWRARVRRRPFVHTRLFRRKIIAIHRGKLIRKARSARYGLLSLW